MDLIQIFYSTFAGIFLFSVWGAWWFKLILVAAVAIAALIFHFRKMAKLKHAAADMQRQLVEKNELLQYAKKGEERANERITQSEKSKTILLSKINHEIRTPMNGVLGMATLLDQTELTTEQKEYTDTILHSGHSLIKVVNEIMISDIVEYSKVESGRELESKEFSLSSCIEEVFDVFAAKAAASGIELLYEIEKSVPDLLLGDVRRVRQVLTNLVENALKFTSEGEIFISTRLLYCKENNNLGLQFQVKDSGAGMPEEQYRRLNHFFKNAASANSQQLMKGAGLVICQKLVALMGGSLQVSAVEKGGSAFLFNINIKAGSHRQKPGEVTITQQADKKILLVNSNTHVSAMIRSQLEQATMLVSVVHTGAEALEMLTQVAFDLVMVDAATSEINCILLTRQIKEKNDALPVLLLKQPGDERCKEDAGLFEAIINKPLKKQALLDAVLAPFRHHLPAAGNKLPAIQKLSEEFASQYPLQILIAEDNLVNQRWVNKILGKLGYRPDTVNNGKEVLEIAGTKQYDLILMDVQMPEMDGMEATKMIRLCLANQPVIIAMTANTMQGDKQDCLQAGMNDYISKPVELNDLMEMLEKWAYLINKKAA